MKTKTSKKINFKKMIISKINSASFLAIKGGTRTFDDPFSDDPTALETFCNGIECY